MSRFRAFILGTPRRRAIALWLTLGLTVCIAALTLVPVNVPEATPGNDKLHHMLAFAALILPCAALYPKALLRVVLAAAFYGGMIEVVQPYVGRAGEMGDFMADLAGIGLGAVLGLGINALCKSRLALRRRGARRRRPVNPINL